MKSIYDAVVIGGGHNGLTAATLLAQKGKSVCVIEKSDQLGGGARSDISHLIYNLDPQIAKQMGCEDLLKSEPLATVALAQDGRHIVMHGDDLRFADGSMHPDAEAFAVLNARLRRYAEILGTLSKSAPPQLIGSALSMSNLAELTRLAKLGLRMKLMGKTEMREFLRIVLSNAFDLVLDEVKDGPLAGAICADASRGNYLGPRSPGTVFNLMYRLGNGGKVYRPKGGMAAVVAGFEAAARSAGCDILTGTGVSQIAVADDAVQSVTLDNRLEIKTKAVLSSAAPLQTMQLAGLAQFDIETTRRARNLRCKGTVARLSLGLSQRPSIPGLDLAQSSARILVAPTAVDVERAFNPAKYGELPEAPALEILIHDADEGQAEMSITLHHVPTGGWTKARRTKMVKTVLKQLETYMPALGKTVTQSQLLTPEDIEERTGAPGGHWHYADMGFDQLLTLRPFNGAAHYQLGVTGLYLCGAAAHPGGDITGAPGRNSAMQLLKDEVA